MIGDDPRKQGYAERVFLELAVEDLRDVLNALLDERRDAMRYQIIPDPNSVAGLAIEDTHTHKIVSLVGVPDDGRNVYLVARDLRNEMNRSDKQTLLKAPTPEVAHGSQN